MKFSEVLPYLTLSNFILLLAILVTIVAYAVTIASKLANYYPRVEWLHRLAQNGEVVRTSLVKVEGVVIDLASVTRPSFTLGRVRCACPGCLNNAMDGGRYCPLHETPGLPLKPGALVFFFALALPALAHAQGVTPQVASDASQLLADTQSLDAAIGKAPAATVTELQTKVNADVTQLAADAGAAVKVIQLGKHYLTFNLGGAAGLQLNFPGSGASVSGEAGPMLDVGFGSSAAGCDHFHVGLAVMVASLTQHGETQLAYAGALTAGYQPASNAPTYGVGPAVICAVKQPCLFGFAFTAGFAGQLGALSI